MGRLVHTVSSAGFTQSKKLVSTEGNLRTHVLNLQMMLSPREEAGFAEVIAGIMQDRHSSFSNLSLLLFSLSALPHLMFESLDSTLNGGSSMLTPHIIS